jgi:hypothetical protein
MVLDPRIAELEESIESDSWNDDTDKFLQTLIDEAETALRKHEKAISYYGLWKHLLGVPGVIIGGVMSVIGTEQVPDMLSRSMFIASSILSSLNYYFQYGKKEVQNRHLADEYSHYIHKVRKTLALARGKRRSCRLVLTEYTNQLSMIRKELATPNE